MNATINPVSKAVSAVLSETTVKDITTTIKADRTTANKWKKLSDEIVADGVTSAMLAKVKKGEHNPHETLQYQINTAIFDSFDKDVQELIKKDTKTLSQIDKGIKAYWGKQIASYYGKIARYVVQSEKEAEDGTNARVPKTKEERIKGHIDDALRIAKSLETATFSIAELVAKLTEAKKIIK